ncbi:MAG: alpha/beta hydrolase [Actinomycetota bacterium]
MTEPLRFASGDGFSLEGEIDAPEDPKATLVICHPHPKMGGTMNAPLLLAVRDDMLARGWAVLRFNFRGIGASEGEPSTGIEEVADADGAIAEASRRYPGIPVALAGWSFGAAVALRALSAHPEVLGCAAIAPAIKPKPGITAGAPDPGSFEPEGDVLLVGAANDDLVSPGDARAWASATGARYEEVKGANHFFWARYEPLTKLVGDFLDGLIA